MQEPQDQIESNPIKSNPMIAVYGHAPNRQSKCGSCVHIVQTPRKDRKNVCHKTCTFATQGTHGSQRYQSMGWNACGLYEPKKQTQTLDSYDPETHTIVSCPECGAERVVYKLTTKHRRFTGICKPCGGVVAHNHRRQITSDGLMAPCGGKFIRSDTIGVRCDGFDWRCKHYDDCLEIIKPMNWPAFTVEGHSGAQVCDPATVMTELAEFFAGNFVDFEFTEAQTSCYTGGWDDVR